MHFKKFSLKNIPASLKLTYVKIGSDVKLINVNKFISI